MRVLLVSLGLLTAMPLGAQYQETITVSRIVVDVRVTKADGEPVTGLTPDQFVVKLGGVPAGVLSATWVTDEAADPEGGAEQLPQDLSPADDAPRDTRTPELRTGAENLYVVFIQTDFARNRARTAGQMKFRTYAEDIIDSLGPRDRIAVFSFDSHLKFRLDFTSDKSRVKRAIADSIRIDFPPAPARVPEPSLSPLLDREEMRLAASSEKALLLVAQALREIDGPKTLMLMGWGLGERVGSVVQTTREWPAARAALLDSRTTVFALDTTEADGHDLSAGLSAAAKATGGFYASTFRFPQGAIDRLKRTLTGYYELELSVPPQLEPGTHTLDVVVKRRGAQVMAPAYVTGG